jgi:hypothetical protein
LLVAQGKLGVLGLPVEQRDRATRLLADTFDVNPIVAQIRLENLYPTAAGGQLTL